MIRHYIVFISLVLWLANASLGETPSERNWPQWRGPMGTGAAPHATPPV